MKKLFIFPALIAFAIIFIISCQKDKPSIAHVDSGSSNTFRTTVSGIVLDESNAPLNGVTVIAYGQATSTDQHGVFVLKNINANKDRCVLQFSKSGFFKRSHGFIASANTVNYVRIILISSAATQNFSSSAGGTISLPDGSSAEFQPNSFVTTNGSAYSGTVNISIKHLSPDDGNFGFMIPGGDLLGTDLDNKDVALYTYGMLGIELTGSSGEALQLATGTTATLTFAIAASQLTNAPASIPLWYFDETTSLWKEEGTANKVGNNYAGTVTHFTWWNCDIGGQSPFIKGRVIDCNNVPVPNCVVTINNWATTLTNQNGEWQGQVPSGILLTAQVLYINNGNIILNSQLENIASLSDYQIYIVPDLIIPCPTRIAGTLKTCAGESTDGYIYISDNSTFFNYQYTANGNFSLISIENTLIDLDAYSPAASYHQAITSLAAPDIFNMGNILICDTMIANSDNWFQITNCTLINDTMINMNNITNSFGNVDSLNGCELGITFNNTISNFEMSIMGSTTGSYNWKTTQSLTSIYCALNTSMSFHTNGSNSGTINIIIGNVGTPLEGNFIGTIEFYKNGFSASADIEGQFKVIRTQ